MWAPPWGPSVSIILQAELVGWLTQKVGLSDVTFKKFILPCFDICSGIIHVIIPCLAGKRVNYPMIIRFSDFIPVIINLDYLMIIP